MSEMQKKINEILKRAHGTTESKIIYPKVSTSWANNDAKVNKFIGKWMRKYNLFIGTTEVRENLDACAALYTGKISIPEFEQETGIICIEASLEEQFQIGL